MSEKASPLTALPAGTRGKVIEINVATGDKARLMEMGLLKGSVIELIRFAPLGDPVEIKVRGYNLTLRKDEADKILVSPL
jgi:ferrous iron transport protein A